MNSLNDQNKKQSFYRRLLLEMNASNSDIEKNRSPNGTTKYHPKIRNYRLQYLSITSRWSLLQPLRAEQTVNYAFVAKNLGIWWMPFWQERSEDWNNKWILHHRIAPCYSFLAG